MNRLSGKTAVITGANSGIGKATAILFAKESAQLVICARRVDKLQEVENEIRTLGGEVVAVPCDVSQVKDVDNLIKTCIDRFGKIDILINAAGVQAKIIQTLGNCDGDDQFDYIMGINAKGPYLTCRAALQYMISAQKGSIVNVSSVSGLTGQGDARYSASKGAVLALTRHIGMVYADRHIRCNAVCPGATNTPMIAANMRGEGADPELLEEMAKHTESCVEVGLNTPEDIAANILFFASDESNNLNGQFISADFGSSL